MIFKAAYLALLRIFTKDFRIMLYKALGITGFILLLLWFSLRNIFLYNIWPYFSQFLPNLPDWLGFLSFIGIIIFSLGLAIIMAFLIAPITAMIGGFFTDKAAEIIEKTDYPKDKLGQEMPISRALSISLRFAIISILGNILVIFLFFIPTLHFIAFYTVNGYLLGREYFEFAACRHLSEENAKKMYKAHAFSIFMAGILITIFISIPILNLLTPLFAAAFMIHFFKMLHKNHKA